MMVAFSVVAQDENVAIAKAMEYAVKRFPVIRLDPYGYVDHQTAVTEIVPVEKNIVFFE